MEPAKPLLTADLSIIHQRALSTRKLVPDNSNAAKRLKKMSVLCSALYPDIMKLEATTMPLLEGVEK